MLLIRHFWNENREANYKVERKIFLQKVINHQSSDETQNMLHPHHHYSFLKCKRAEQNQPTSNPPPIMGPALAMYSLEASSICNCEG